jgi:hypothetical protein
MSAGKRKERNWGSPCCRACCRGDVGGSQAFGVFSCGLEAVRQRVGAILERRSGWYPDRPKSFSTHSNFELTFHSPESYALVATGTKRAKPSTGLRALGKARCPSPSPASPMATVRFTATRLAAWPSMCMRMESQTRGWAGIQRHFDSGGTPGVLGSGVAGAVGNLTPSAMAKTMGIEMANTVRVFADYFGPYPYKQLCVTSLPISYSYGQGWPGLVYLWSVSLLDATQRAYYLEFLGVIGGSGKTGRRFGSPRAPRTSTSSKRSEGATTAAGRPLCALPKAPSAVPAMPFTWLCI